MRRKLYWKRLLIVIAVAIALSGGAFGVHRIQVKSQASVLRERAEKAVAEAGEDFDKHLEAISLMQQYLRYRPTDAAAFQQYAQMLIRLAEIEPSPATTQFIADGVEEFLRAFPNHPVERKKLARLYINSGQFGKLASAKAHLKMLMDAPDSSYRTDVEVLEMAATCEEGQGNLAAAIGYLDTAINTNAAPVPIYLRVMELLHKNKSDPKRSAAIDHHLRALRSGRFAENLEARVAAARFEMFLGNLGPARADMNFAFEQLGGGEDPDALLMMAELELKGGGDLSQIKVQQDKAAVLLRQAHQKDGSHVAVGLLLADVLARQGNRAEGIAVLKRIAETLPPTDFKIVMILDQLCDLGEQEATTALVDSRLAKYEAGAVFTTYFRGRLAVLKEDWLEARPLLEEAGEGLIRAPTYHKKAMVGLAACYSAMQNPDKQLEYCKRALVDDPGFFPAVIGRAEALVRMGKFADALPLYRILVYRYNLDFFREELARLELLNLLGQPIEVNARDWNAFEDSLGPVEKRTALLLVYEADGLIARGRSKEAGALLEGWLKERGKEPEASIVWVALARFNSRGGVGSTTGVFDEARKHVGYTVPIRLAEADFLVIRSKPPVSAEFDRFLVDIASFTQQERFQLFHGLGKAAARAADRGLDAESTRALRETAIRLLQRAAELSPRDLSVRSQLLDLGLAAGRKEVVHEALRDIAAVEGAHGPVGTLGRIAQALPEVNKQSDPDSHNAALQSLREQAEHVRTLRPGWSRVYVALASIDELLGKTDTALANYREAIDKGDRQEFVLRKTIELYRIKQQDDQAVGLLDKLSTEVTLPDDLERYRAIYRMLSEDIPKESRPTIDRVAPAAANDYRIQLLRGSLLAAIREDGEALKAYYRAVELADRSTETWVALVAQLMRYGRADEAKRAVAEAVKKLAISPPTKAVELSEHQLALGQLHDLIGDAKAALTYYNAACDTAPLQLNPIRQRILFYQRTGQLAQAVEQLDAARNSISREIAHWARRHLALNMIGGGEAYQRRKLALALVEQNLAAVPDNAEDLKARAVIWTVDPATRDDGIRTLRQFGDRGDLTPFEWHLLGQFAFNQGKFAESERYFKLAARIRPGVQALHLASLIRVYLALNQIGLAETVLERLKTNNHGSWEATREEARLLHRKSRIKLADREEADARKLLEQARTAIMKFPDWDSGKNLAARTGPLFEELELWDDAEAAYKKFLETEKSPAAHLPLARFYIFRKQPERAIALAREYEKTAPLWLTARLLTGAVRMKRTDPAAEAEIAKWLDEAIRNAAGKTELEAALIGSRAELLSSQGNDAEAIKEYERSIQINRTEHTINNLCMSIALHDPTRAPDAINMITEIIDIYGPQPHFLDTRALLYIVCSKPAEAKKDLDLAIVLQEQALFRFRLAWALDLDGQPARRATAIEELKRAKQLGLTRDDLHPKEYRRYLELLNKYGLEEQ